MRGHRELTNIEPKFSPFGSPCNYSNRLIWYIIYIGKVSYYATTTDILVTCFGTILFSYHLNLVYDEHLPLILIYI